MFKSGVTLSHSCALIFSSSIIPIGHQRIFLLVRLFCPPLLVSRTAFRVRSQFFLLVSCCRRHHCYFCCFIHYLLFFSPLLMRRHFYSIVWFIADVVVFVFHPIAFILYQANEWMCLCFSVRIDCSHSLTNHKEVMVWMFIVAFAHCHCVCVQIGPLYSYSSIRFPTFTVFISIHL